MTTSAFPGANISRRTVLVGGLATGLAACSSSGSAATGTSEAADDAALEPPLLLASFPDGIRQPTILADVGTQRGIFVLSRGRGALDADQVPASLPATLTYPDGSSSDVSLPRHANQVPRHYYPLLFEPNGAGTYTLDSELEGELLSASFTVASPADVSLVQIGDQMPSLVTPTTGDSAGVDPICTRTPEPCDFHQITLADAVASGQPTALMISTPAFCQTGICGPTLEILIGQLDAVPDMQVVHAEVYTDPARLGELTPAELLAPTVSAFGMSFEPSLIVADGNGTITAKLDVALDADDIAAALASAT